MRKWIYVLTAIGLGMLLFSVVQVSSARAEEQDQIVALGKAIFFDTDLSINGTQSCATCHAPEVGFTGPDLSVQRQWSSLSGCTAQSLRKPKAAVQLPTPVIALVLHFDNVDGGWFGGMF